MTIYIEYVVIDNLAISWALLLCVSKTVQIKYNYWLILLSVLCGTITSILFPLVVFPIWLTFICKCFVGAVMVFIVSSTSKFKKYIIQLLLFFIYTFALGGTCFGVITMLDGSVLISQNAYSFAFPIGLLIACVTIFCIMIIKISNYINQKKVYGSFILNVSITIMGKTKLLKGFIDSGNRLIDTKTLLPIMIIEKCKLIDFECKMSDLKMLHNISIQTVDRSSKMLVFKPEKIIINNEEKYAMIGISNLVFNDSLSYDILLNPSMI